MASLFVVQGKARGSYYVLEDGMVVIGRDEHADIQIVDEMISRRHLEVTYDAEKEACRIKDLQSANGVFVGGKRISGEVEIKDGDTIRIGETSLLYTIKSIRDLDTAIAFIKKRGEHGKSTLIK
ncbi:MAG: FHA domain-containing protein [Planctomycetota bacterium]|jgi:pSer/pThr/pTyr-binding forkhead associated (FHA) protein